MRIFDLKGDKSLDTLTIYLTLPEAGELRDSLNSLLTGESHHEHIPSADYQKEITVTIYDTLTLESFDDRSKMLIKYDI